MWHETSAGILLYRRGRRVPRCCSGHMGGPFWAKKDDGAWSLPKGEHGADEEPLAVARREFEEELGSPRAGGDLVPLGEARVTSGKVLTVWAAEGDLDAGSRRQQHLRDGVAAPVGPDAGVPRDRPGGLVPRSTRRGAKLVKGQVPFLDRLVERLAAPS